MEIRLNVPHIRQRQNGECIAASAAMVLTYLQYDISYEQLLKTLQIKWFGTPSFYVRELEKLGVRVIYKQGTLHELQEHLANDRPCIAFVKTIELPYWDEASDHAVVVIGLDDNSVYLNDPAFEEAPKIVPRGDFDLAWLGRDELYATFLRK